MALGRALKLDVIAEGVERVGQLEALRALGCGYIQGYYFSRPVEAEAIAVLLRDGGFPPGPRS